MITRVYSTGWTMKTSPRTWIVPIMAVIMGSLSQLLQETKSTLSITNLCLKVQSFILSALQLDKERILT
jgi:hypothetical protein